VHPFFFFLRELEAAYILICSARESSSAGKGGCYGRFSIFRHD
jgi:hypothetical protein